MADTTHTLATAVLSQGLLDGAEELQTLLTTGLAVFAIAVVFIALRRVAQVVSALVAAAAAVGSVLVVVVVLVGLLAAVLMLGFPA